ncbi:DUF5667 domain-containing protein [Chloroflexota bacterium]
MKRIEEILIQCIEDIKAGKASVADCLDRYPDMRHELEPLLRIALSIKESANISPSDAFKVRARINLMEHIHNSSQLGKRAVRSSSQAGVRHGWYTGWARAVAVVVAVILFISALGTGTAYASQDSLPGDTLYPVKLGTEQVQRVITFNDAAETELELKFANTRLEEMKDVADKRPDKIAVAVAGYERNLSLAIMKAEQSEEGETSLETVALAILNHLNRLDEIEDGAPEAARGAVINSKEIAINGHMKILQNLAKVNLVRANEINLQMIQGRLDRAEAEAVKGNSRGAEDTLREYEKLRGFGEAISNSTKGVSQDSGAVDQPKGTAPAEQEGSSDHSQTSQESKETTEQSNSEQNAPGQQQQGEQSNIPTETPVPSDGDSNNTSQPEPNKPENERR